MIWPSANCRNPGNRLHHEITPWPATFAVMTLVAAPLGDRLSAGLLGGAGLFVLAVGLATLATLPPSAGSVDVAWRLVLCGVGFRFFQSPSMKALMSSAPRDRSGSAGGILAASRLLGQSFGAAAVAICLSVSPSHGIEAAIWLGAATAVLGSFVSCLRLLPLARARQNRADPTNATSPSISTAAPQALGEITRRVC